MRFPSERPIGFRAGVLRRVLPLLVTLLFCAVSLPARAQSAPILVAPFQGAKKDGVRELVVELLESDGYDVVPTSETPNVDPSGESPYFADLAQQGNIKAFVMGYTSLKKSGWSTSITVREGKTGDVVGKVVIEAAWYPGLQKALRERAVSRLSGPLKRAEAPGTAKASVAETEPAPESEDAATDDESASESDWADEAEDETEDEAEEESSDDEDEDAAASSGQTEDAPSSLELELGPLFVYRSWQISDPLLDAYDGPLSPEHFTSMFGAQGKLRIYPTGLAGDTSIFRHLGLEAAFARTFVGNTVVADSVANPDRVTIFQEFTAGLRIRIPAGPVEIGLFGGIGRQALSIAGEKVIAAQPDARYDFFRAGADFGLLLSESLMLSVGGAYRGVSSLGEDPGQVQNEAWFPNATGAGWDTSLRATLLFTENLGLRLGAMAMFYAFDFDPQLEQLPTAGPPPPIAGGATDFYAGTDLSLVVLLH